MAKSGRHTVISAVRWVRILGVPTSYWLKHEEKKLFLSPGYKRGLQKQLSSVLGFKTWIVPQLGARGSLAGRRKANEPQKPLPAQPALSFLHFQKCRDSAEAPLPPSVHNPTSKRLDPGTERGVLDSLGGKGERRTGFVP